MMISQYSFDYEPEKTKAYSKSRIDEVGFGSWKDNNHFRTTYGSHFCQNVRLKIQIQIYILPGKQQQKKSNLHSKNSAIPGYRGFIPGMVSTGAYSKRYTELSKDAFANPDLGKNINKLSTTGFNSSKHDFVDLSKTGWSHKYGSQTNQKNHPCLDNPMWKTHYQDIHAHPLTRVHPTFRHQNDDCLTQKKFTRKSGFSSNSEAHDGNGWTPHEVLNGDRKKTEYRIRYNSEKPFHRGTHLFNLRSLKKEVKNNNVSKL